MKHSYLYILICLLTTSLLYCQTNIYVSPTPLGSDLSGDGTSAKPFQTIQKAKDYVRTINQSMTNDIVINITEGTYELSEKLNFEWNDSGFNDHYIIYQSNPSNTQPVIISGGTKIINWSNYDNNNNIWKAEIDTLYSRQLYVDGVKAIRARSEDNLGLVETKDGYFSSCQNVDFSNWNNIKDMEVVSNIHWRNHRIPVETVCGRQIHINNSFWKYIHKQAEFERSPAYWLENSLNLLNTENEWYIDKKAKFLYYKPIGNINDSVALNNLNIILPRLEKLLVGNYVNNIKFNNLVFSYSTWNKPSIISPTTKSNFGFFTEQGDRYYEIKEPNKAEAEEIPGSVSFNNSNNVIMQNNLFTHIGSTGLTFSLGSRNSIICNNRFIDISASGMRLGNYDNFWEDSDVCCTPGSQNNRVVRDNFINNNFIEDIANEYFGSIGILVSIAQNTKIIHNTLQNFPYTGISIGYGFTPHLYSGVNTVSNNKIDCSKQFMPDAGGIYTMTSLGYTDSLSVEHRTMISNNYILNHKFYRGSIYLDSFSSNVNVQNNLIDIEDNVNIVPKINCKDNNVSSIAYWWGSQNISIIDNYFNSKYLNPPPINDCISVNGRPCANINIQSNNSFVGFSNNINTIKDNSGQNQTIICN